MDASSVPELPSREKINDIFSPEPEQNSELAAAELEATDFRSELMEEVDDEVGDAMERVNDLEMLFSDQALPDRVDRKIGQALLDVYRCLESISNHAQPAFTDASRREELTEAMYRAGKWADIEDIVDRQQKVLDAFRAEIAGLRQKKAQLKRDKSQMESKNEALGPLL